jgi:predicted AlkP superfamily pyrophosphatase or phosphodiesterase
MKQVLIIGFSAFSCFLNAQVSEELVVPRLVVGITIDQMRADMLARYWSGFGQDGFQRLIRNGSWMLDTRFHYVPTYTGPGHASIYTGTGPARHGIAANDWYDRDSDSYMYCVGDAESKSIGGAPNSAGRAPRNLMATTIADELERHTAGRSKTIGISLKDRGAILPIGRTGDMAYWFDPVSGNFVSSSWYTKGLPTWVREFNKEERAKLYLSKPWELLHPKEFYENNMTDDNPYERAIGGAAEPTIPLDLPGLYAKNGNLGLVAYTPLGNKLLTDMAISAILHEELGIDEVTDLLTISYSSTDHVGHAAGPRSMEVEDTYYRLDREIARLLVELDELVGEDRYLLFLTSDHGAVDVPAYLQQLKGSAGYVVKDSITYPIERVLERKYGTGPWIAAHLNYQLYLNDDLARERGVDLSDLQEDVLAVLRQDEMVAEVVTADQLLDSEFTRGLRALMQEGFVRHRSGDIMYALHPGYLLEPSDGVHRGTNHATGYSYDTQVPLLFFGYGIPERQVARSVTIKDIAPTIAMWCGFALPDACEGHAIHEVFKED